MADRRFKLINAGLTEQEIADADALYLTVSGANLPTGNMNFQGTAFPNVQNDVYYQCRDSGGTSRAIMALNSADRLIIKNPVDSVDIRLQATNSSSGLQNGFIFNADGKAQIYHGGSNTVAIHTADRTATDRVSSIIMNAADGAVVSVGEALQRFSTKNTNFTMAQSDHGNIFYKGNGSAYNWTTPASTDTNIPVGWWVKGVVQGASAVTILVGSGTNLRWTNGDGLSPGTGTRTIARSGFFTLYKRSDTEYYIEGVGIT